MQRVTAVLITILILSPVEGSSPAYAHRRGGVPWCGIWMMQHTGIHGPGNLARAIEWEHVGHAAAGPGPNIIGVMAHHVFQVISVIATGRVLAISGNDGGAVRTRERSTRGVVAWRSL